MEMNKGGKTKINGNGNDDTQPLANLRYHIACCAYIVVHDHNYKTSISRKKQEHSIANTSKFTQ